MISEPLFITQAILSIEYSMITAAKMLENLLEGHIGGTLPPE